ncbi:MAG: carbohydrate kinase [Hyphomicrobiales bacterium]|nr:MAG: carbohydrate kinase [Hyphomicrobiales bacterium]
MKQQRYIAIIDIGKTNAKVALVDMDCLKELRVCTTPNHVVAGPPYAHYDTHALWQFICASLKTFHAEFGVDAISVSAHGATLAMVDEHGGLAGPIMDYEFSGFDDTWQAYQAHRPPFEESGSPLLPGGLNSAAQLYWIQQNCPKIWQRTKRIVTYPQYWSGHLSGVFVNEVTSLGSHSDLWNPHKSDFSSIVERLGFADKMAPVKPANTLLGNVRPEMAEACGLPNDVAVYCGIHDSNASLYPYLLLQRASFNVVSTGTWVISMAIGSTSPTLDPARDTLVNVNAFGDRVPSARFMGGREFSLMVPEGAQSPDSQILNQVLASKDFIRPQVFENAGPYMGQTSNWQEIVEGKSSTEIYALASLYLALVSAECLTMIGLQKEIIVEGPFAKNDIYLEMLGIATGKDILVNSSSDTGTTIGAALLVGRSLKENEFQCKMAHTPHLPAMKTAFEAYRDNWKRDV